jgi:hypothetical protein
LALEDGAIRVAPSGEERPIQDRRKQLWCIPDGARVQAMIATVPDPVQTHMALTFDRIIEAVQMAAGSMGYVIDYYWLPWDVELKADWGDYDSLAAAAKEQKQKEAQPGLLLFRWNGGRQEAKATVLYVFLVGETSTAGINSEQFARATEYIQQLRLETHPGCKSVSCIHIIGPTFSGSLDSLRRLVEAQAAKGSLSFVIKSGTVSSQSAIDNSPFIGKTTFQTFERTIDGDVLDKVRDLLLREDSIDNPENCHDVIPQVAILSEVGTTFGETVRPNKLKQQQEQQQDNKPRPLCFDMFFYSREIASLRNAYQDTAGSSPAAGSNNPAERPWLSFNLTDRANRGDEPPDFSQSQSPLSKEAVLMNITAQMRRNHYRYIGIIGTNTLDRIFLVNLLRKAVPDARLFLFNADLLLARDLDNIPYIGTLAITAYPLLDPNLVGSPRNIRLPFSEHIEVGSYNASVCTISELIGAGQDETKNALYGYPDSCPDPNAAPNPFDKPLWLTAVGTGGYWPVEILSRTELDPPILPKAPTAAWTAAATLLFALAILHFLVLIGISPFSPKFRDFALGTLAPFHQLFAIHLASATLALSLMLVGTPTKRGGWNWATVPIVLLVFACVLLTTKYLLWRKAKAEKSSAEPAETTTDNPVRHQIGQSLLWIGRVALIPGIWVLAGYLAYLWWELFSEVKGYYGFFFAYRASHLASVVSPLAPMLPLLATVYLWSVFYAWRLRFHDSIRPRLNPSWESPDKRSGEDKLRPGWRSEKRISKAINGQFLTSAYDWCGVAIFTAWLVLFERHRPFEPFEQPNFGWIYRVLFCLAILLILVSGFRLAEIWQELRALLLELKRKQEVKVVFTRLREDWPSIWFYGSEDADWDYMVRSYEMTQKLRSIIGGHRPLQLAESSVVKEIRETRRDMQDEGFLQRVKHTFSAEMVDEKLEKLTRHSQEAQEYMAVTLNQALDLLQGTWRSQPPWLEEDNSGNKSEEGAVIADEVSGWQKLLEKYVALRYVAFIRAVLARIRLLLIFLTVSFTLVLLSLVIYSFEPHRALIWSVTGIFALIGFIIVKVLMQVHRDPILSRITGTKANELGLTFYIRIAALGAAPLLTLLATHFPSIGRYIVSFLQPGLEALK